MKMIYDAKCVKVHLKQIYMLKIYISCKISVSIVHGNQTHQIKNEYLHLNAKETKELAPQVAKIMAKQLNHDENWEQEQIELFLDLAKKYHI